MDIRKHLEMNVDHLLLKQAKEGKDFDGCCTELIAAAESALKPPSKNMGQSR